MPELSGSYDQHSMESMRYRSACLARAFIQQTASRNDDQSLLVIIAATIILAYSLGATAHSF